MSCPFQGNRIPKFCSIIHEALFHVINSRDDNNDTGLRPGQVGYNEYLKIPDLLKCQLPRSEKIENNLVHDEYLFIIIHQTYELWFKQIIIELDSIRKLLLQSKLDEGNTLLIVSRLSRVVKIQKVLVEQIGILETMTAQDFGKFRKYLSPASGFQSWQFRLIENKLGICKEKRIKHNNNDYTDAPGLTSTERETIRISEKEPALLNLVDNWLSRTPGLETDGFDFTGKLKKGVSAWLKDLEDEANSEENAEVRDSLLNDLKLTKTRFDNMFDEDKHESLKMKGDRRLSFKAFQGALFIFFYRDEPRFNQPFQILTLLMDIDSLLIKWRYNHAILVQRMIGGKFGTGGSSGYQYLLATASDRYKVFLDLFNLASFIIPHEYIPELDVSMKNRLSVFKLEMSSEETGEMRNNECS